MKLFFLIALIATLETAHAQKNETFEIQRKCSDEATKFYSRKKFELISPNTSAVNYFTIHYNKKTQECLIRVSHHVISGLSYKEKSDSIFNVLENKEITSYFATENKNSELQLYVCRKINGGKCYNEAEYHSDSDKLMAE